MALRDVAAAMNRVQILIVVYRALGKGPLAAMALRSEDPYNPRLVRISDTRSGHLPVATIAMYGLVAFVYPGTPRLARCRSSRAGTITSC